MCLDKESHSEKLSATNYNNNDNKHIFRFMCHVRMCMLYRHTPASKSVSTTLPAAFYLVQCTCRHVYLLHSKLKQRTTTTYSQLLTKDWEKNMPQHAFHGQTRVNVFVWTKRDMHAVRETNNNNIHCKWLKLYAPNIQIKGHVHFPLISFCCCRCRFRCLLSFIRLVLVFFVQIRVYMKWSANIILSCAIKQCLLYLNRYHVRVSACVNDWRKLYLIMFWCECLSYDDQMLLVLPVQIDSSFSFILITVECSTHAFFTRWFKYSN